MYSLNAQPGLVCLCLKKKEGERLECHRVLCLQFCAASSEIAYITKQKPRMWVIFEG